MEIGLNLDEAIFVKSALIQALKKEDRESLLVLWSDANFANVLRQLDAVIDALFKRS
jgi:hypothetical protein